MLDKISKFISKHSGLVVIIAILLLIPSAIGAIRTRVNYDILSYLPEDLDSSKGTKELEDTFHSAATTMLIVEGMPPKYTEELRSKIADIDGVSDAFWIDSIVDISFPKEMLPDKVRDMFYSKTADATMMVVNYDKPGAADETRNALAQIYSICNEKCFVAGVSAITDDIAKLVDTQMPLYVVIAVVLSLIALLFALDSWFLPLVLLLTIGFAIMYNMGTNIFLGEISYITKAIAAILQLAVSMDYSIFLVSRFEEEKKNYEHRHDAMAEAIKAAFSSLFGSSLTTAAGFFALCFMRLTLGKDIGIVMVKGVVLSVITVILVLPGMILFFDKLINKFKHRNLVPSFKKINGGAVKYSKTITIIFLIMFIPTAIMQNKVELYYNITRALPQDLPSIVATDKLKKDFDMASTHFVIVDDSLPRYELESMESEIEELDGISSLLAYDKIIGSSIPDSFIPQQIKDICKKGGKQMLMINSKYEAASDEENNQIDELTRIVKSYDETALVTGEGPMTKDLFETCAVDFKVTNYISILAILLIVGIVFKSFTVPIVLVSTIELAIFLNMSISFIMGKPIPFISPTVISCIQLGATVDYAILMTTRFKEEMQSGKNRLEAIYDASRASTHSIVTSSLVLFCATLGVGLISDIEIISSMCIMLARGAVISGLVSLLVFPAVLFAFEPLFEKTTPSWPKGEKVSFGKNKGNKAVKVVR